MRLFLILVHIFINVEVWIATSLHAMVKRLIIAALIIPMALCMSLKLFRRGGDLNRVVSLINQRWVLWSRVSTIPVAAPPLGEYQVAEAVLIVVQILIHN